MPVPELSRHLRWALRGLAFAVLLGIVFILGSINVPFLEPDEPSEVILLYVFSGVVFLAFVIYALVLTRYLVRLYTEHRQQVLGAKFKTKMVAGALALSLLPIVALFFISYALVNRTLGKWFPRPLENVRDEARALTDRLLEEEEGRAAELASELAADRDLLQLLARRDPAALQAALSRRVEFRAVDWIAIVDAAGTPLAVHRRAGSQADFLTLVPSLLEPRAALAYTTRERVAGGQFALARVRMDAPEGSPPGAVVVAREIAPALLNQIEAIDRESAAYDALKSESKSYRWQALLILLLITVLLLLAATWSALQLAKQVTIPIQALAVATEEVSRGNFDYRVDVPAKDELGTLVASFNEMTGQLGESRRNLERALSELEHRRQWIETILESIPTGVLTLSSDLRVLKANAGALALLGRSEAVAEGARLDDLLSGEALELSAALIAQAANRGFAAGQMEFRQARLPDGQAERIAHLAASVSALHGGPEPSGRSQGYVLVLDDLTDLLKAEKAAAWQEVAQRIAHEIKNPLTPIQLSADRIRRYLERTGEADPVERARYSQLIAQCASLIAQEVQGLKTLVDEFSRFARFPVVEPAPTQLNEVVEGTLALYRDALNGVALSADLAAALPPITGDPALLRRVLVNLIDNAAEAVSRSPDSSSAAGSVVVRTRFLDATRRVELSVSDTGPGISPEDKERLFLPFFSTKPNGMGLGLAIVSRIVAEHRGRIRVEDNQPSGTRFVVDFPAESAVPARAVGATRLS